MTKNEIKRIEELLNFIQDKVEDVYAAETAKAIKKYLDEVKN